MSHTTLDPRADTRASPKPPPSWVRHVWLPLALSVITLAGTYVTTRPAEYDMTTAGYARLFEDIQADRETMRLEIARLSVRVETQARIIDSLRARVAHLETIRTPYAPASVPQALSLFTP